jgi:hypothetical protein
MLTPFNTIVNDIGENDILLGRGTGPNENQGNIRYRQTITEVFLEDHVQSANPLSKFKLASKIVQTVNARNARFLRKLTKAEVKAVLRKRPTAHDQEHFMVVSDKVAIDKTRQALRFQSQKCNNWSCPRSTADGKTKLNQDSSKLPSRKSPGLTGHSKSGAITKTPEGSRPSLPTNLTSNLTNLPFDPSVCISMRGGTAFNRVDVANGPRFPNRLMEPISAVPNQESREQMLARMLASPSMKLASQAGRIPICPTKNANDVYASLARTRDDLALLLQRRQQSEMLLRLRLLGFRV